MIITYLHSCGWELIAVVADDTLQETLVFKQQQILYEMDVL